MKRILLGDISLQDLLRLLKLLMASGIVPILVYWQTIYLMETIQRLIITTLTYNHFNFIRIHLIPITFLQLPCQ